MGAVKFCLRPSPAPDALNHPRPVHRLDAATCGLVVCGKTRSAMAALSLAFQNRTVSKRLVAGVGGRRHSCRRARGAGTNTKCLCCRRSCVYAA